jgi:hypothetical protein
LLRGKGQTDTIGPEDYPISLEGNIFRVHIKIIIGREVGIRRIIDPDFPSIPIYPNPEGYWISKVIRGQEIRILVQINTMDQSHPGIGVTAVNLGA